MKHYPHHIGDFNNATRHLTRVERSVYRDLLDLYYDTEKPLTLDRAALCRLVLARSEEESTAVEQVLNEFFYETPTGWFNERCEEEIAAYQANNSQKALAGKASAEAKRLRRQQALNGKSTSVATPVERPLNPVATAVNGASTNQSTNEPINLKEEKKEPRKRDLSPSLVVRPDGVSEGVWVDWLALRRKKSAPVTPTVLQGAEAEARKAGMSLDAFLRIWCTRGSQGLQAEWLKPSERPQQVATRHDIEPEWRRRERERNEAFLGPAAIRRTDPNTIEAQIRDITPDLLTGS